MGDIIVKIERQEVARYTHKDFETDPLIAIDIERLPQISGVWHSQGDNNPKHPGGYCRGDDNEHRFTIRAGGNHVSNMDIFYEIKHEPGEGTLEGVFSNISNRLLPWITK